MLALTFAVYNARKLLGIGSNKPAGELKSVDEVVGNISYVLSERIFVLGEGLGGVEAEKCWISLRKTSDGIVPKFAKTDNAAGAYSALMTSAEKGEMLTVLTDADSLVPLISVIQNLADRDVSAVFHVSASEEDILNVYTAGTILLSSQTAQEAYDFSVAAHVISQVTKTPVIHFHDGITTQNTYIHILNEAQLDSVLSNKFEHNDNTWDVVDTILDCLAIPLGHRYKAFEYLGSPQASQVVVAVGVAGAVVTETVEQLNKDGKSVGVLCVRMPRPFSASHIVDVLPPTTTSVTILQGGNGEQGWNPLFLDLVASVHTEKKDWTSTTPTVSCCYIRGNVFSPAMAKAVFDNLFSPRPKKRFTVGPDTSVLTNEEPSEAIVSSLPVMENPYLNMLSFVFADRLDVANEMNKPTIWGQSRGTMEEGYGIHLANIQRRARLCTLISELIATNDGTISDNLRTALIAWLAVRDDQIKVSAAAKEAERLIDSESENTNEEALSSLSLTKGLMAKPSRWLVGSDDWARDISDSGIHHVISSGEDINILVIDTQPYSQPPKYDLERFKRDIGLYAMNYGGCYVASIAIYSSYTQAIKAFVEADAFNGPSIVLAYLPNVEATNESLPLEMLKETKRAVDMGLWPLYRWNPKLEMEDRDPFRLDSLVAKQTLKDFLERQNNLSQLCKKAANYSHALSTSTKTVIEGMHVSNQEKATEAYAALAKGLNTTPLVILYGSETGNGEAVAQRLAGNASMRGLTVHCMAAEEVSVDDLALEANVVFIMSTMGQGEFTANSKDLWKDLLATTISLSNTRFAVFALGDSHYWPRPDEKIYFAKPGYDLDERLEGLGAQRMAPLMIGDDQDEDGYWTAYNLWEPLVWVAMGVDKVQVGEAPKAKTDNDMKLGSNFLRGTIAEGLADTTTGYLCEADTKLTKFHGIYQQDDRDLREERRKQGLSKAFSFMIRIRLPGGISTAKQWLAVSALSDSHGCGSVKLTTRQAYQLHGVVKTKLKPTIQAINASLMDTLAACGDVNRNVMCSPIPYTPEVQERVEQFSKDLSAHLSPRTPAYHEIWLDKTPVASSEDVEPLYGPSYLPRKFKMAIAVPPMNDVDVFSNCVGFIAIVEGTELLGYNVVVGGGMAFTHNNKKTYPCLGQVLGFVTCDQAVNVAEKIMLIQRDHGDRTNRKHARLKYTFEDLGFDWFVNELETRCGHKLQKARPYKFTDNSDRYGWTEGVNGTWNYCLYIENGRVRDSPGLQMKTALDEIARAQVEYDGDFRLTSNQHLIFGNVPGDRKQDIDAILSKYDLDNSRHTKLRLHSMACVALPTCSLAFAESERYLPTFVTKLEKVMDEAGVADDAITIRMTGCPNGCARPALAEIALVGRAIGTYNLYLGGSPTGERLNKIYREALNEEQILSELKPVIVDYAQNHYDHESFGDFVIRAGYVKATKNGRDFHEV